MVCLSTASPRSIASNRHLCHIIAMKWNELLLLLRGEPIFHSSLLLSGTESTTNMRRQLTRWVDAGHLLQLRRGVYVVAEPYRKQEPHPFNVANRLKAASYVSLQSALSHYGFIPEHVPTVTSVTTGRPEALDTPLGSFLFRHIDKRLFFGYQSIATPDGRGAFAATPEKAILDLVYLTPGGDSIAYLNELRLQKLEDLDEQRLIHLAQRIGSAKLVRAVGRIAHLMKTEQNQ